MRCCEEAAMPTCREFPSRVDVSRTTSGRPASVAQRRETELTAAVIQTPSRPPLDVKCTRPLPARPARSCWLRSSNAPPRQRGRARGPPSALPRPSRAAASRAPEGGQRG
eukprot:1192268-Prorocentrum_minimum.AAC.2